MLAHHVEKCETRTYNGGIQPMAEQTNWRYCQKCHAMFFNGYQGGRCPAGGSHMPRGLPSPCRTKCRPRTRPRRTGGSA